MGKPREFKNTPQGHVALINRLRKAKVSRVCLEATGQYHLDLALDDAGLDVMVINPKAAKHFATYGLLCICPRSAPRATTPM